MQHLVEQMAKVREEADASYKAAKNLNKDAAELYQKADRIWTAKIVADRIKYELGKKGPVLLEPDLINEVVDYAVTALLEDGLYCSAVSNDD